MNSKPIAPQEPVIKFSDLWAMFWNFKKWYVLALVVAVAFAVLYLYRTPKTYNTSAQVMIDESTQEATMRNLGLEMTGMMSMRSSESIENEMVAFTSPDLLMKVVDKLDLNARYYEKQFLRTVEHFRTSPIQMTLAGENMRGGFSLELEPEGESAVRLTKFMARGEELKTDIVAELGDTVQTPVGALAFFPTDSQVKLKNRMTISWTPSVFAARAYKAKLTASLSGKQSSVIILNFADNFPDRAEQVLNTLIDTYNEVWIYNKNRANMNTSEFIEARLVGLEKELDLVETSLRDYKESHNVTDLQAIAQAQIQESTTYSAKTFEVSNQLSIAQYIKEYLEDPSHAISLIPSNLGLSEHSVDNQIAEYNRLLLQRERLIAGSSVNNPIVQDLKETLVSLRAAILRSIDNLINSLQMQKDKLDSKERQLMNRMSKSTDQEFELLSIERNQKIKQQLYVFLLQKREENDMAALVNVGNTRVLMAPFCNRIPVEPRSMMILLVALVLGFGIPFGVIFMIETMDTRIKSREDLANMKAPFLAEIPHIGKPVSWAKRHLRTNKHENDDDSLRSRMVVKSGSRDGVNESFRVLRTNTDMMLGQKGEEAKVVMLTSFLPNMGKSMTTLNLAASMALKNDSVLVIDLDLRKGSLSKALKLKHSGVAAYLNCKTDDYLSLADEIAPNLQVLPVGSIPPNPSELLVSGRFDTLIADARKHFDYIFLDCPPIDIVADSGIITSYVDMTLFVVRSLQMKKPIIRVIDHIYEEGKYKHMAIVLNDVQYKYSHYGYGKYGYSYGKGYGYGKGGYGSYTYGEEEKKDEKSGK